MAKKGAPQGIQSTANTARSVKRARRREKDIRERQLDELRTVLATPEGRAVIYRFLEKAGIFRSVYSDRPNLLPYLAGRQDFGHYMMGEVEAAEPEALFGMMVEAKAAQRKKDAENAAEQTPEAGVEPEADDET